MFDPELASASDVLLESFIGTSNENRRLEADSDGTVSRTRFVVSPIIIDVKNVSPSVNPSGIATSNDFVS